jgi:hypothetical protein
VGFSSRIRGSFLPVDNDFPESVIRFSFGNAARRSILALRAGDIRRVDLVDDGVTEALARCGLGECARDLDRLTLVQMKEILLGAEWVGPKKP